MSAGANGKLDSTHTNHHEFLESQPTAKDLDSIELTETGHFVWLVAITASIAGALFGYDTGIISAVLVYLGTDLDGQLQNASHKEAITSLCSGGAFFGAIIAGLSADKYGRKAGIYAGCLLFTIGALLQATAYSFAQMW
jgi:MFS transporter, SP family, solute carrier family 2 (myo-inositol transporter), member 13